MTRAARRSLLAFGLLGSTLAARPARADDSKVRCAAAYEQGQVLRRQDKLVASRGQLLICEETCPKALVTDCRRWLAELDALMPTVSLTASDGQGHPSVARVFVDGSLAYARLPQGPVPVDAGDHAFRFESPSGATDEVRVTLHGGERGHAVAAVFSPPPTPPPPSVTTPGGSHWTYAAVGVGAVGLGLGLALSIAGHVEASHLQSVCAPSCAPSRVDPVAGEYDAAWISGGIGLAAAVTALILWQPWRDAPAKGDGRLFVAPTPGGAQVGFRWP